MTNCNVSVNKILLTSVKLNYFAIYVLHNRRILNPVGGLKIVSAGYVQNSCVHMCFHVYAYVVSTTFIKKCYKLEISEDYPQL